MDFAALLKLRAFGRGKRETCTYFVHKNYRNPPLPRESRTFYYVEVAELKGVLPQLTFWQAQTSCAQLGKHREKLLALGWEETTGNGYALAETLFLVE